MGAVLHATWITSADFAHENFIPEHADHPEQLNFSNANPRTVSTSKTIFLYLVKFFQGFPQPSAEKFSGCQATKSYPIHL